MSTLFSCLGRLYYYFPRTSLFVENVHRTLQRGHAVETALWVGNKQNREASCFEDFNSHNPAVCTTEKSKFIMGYNTDVCEFLQCKNS